jgi:COP9 signalosome complex subunit 1
MDTTLPDASGPSRADMDTAALEATAPITNPRARVPVKVEGISTPARGYLRNDVAVPR